MWDYDPIHVETMWEKWCWWTYMVGICNCSLQTRSFVRILGKCLPSGSTHVNVHLMTQLLTRSIWFFTSSVWPQLLVAGKASHLIWGFGLKMFRFDPRYCENTLTVGGGKKKGQPWWPSFTCRKKMWSEILFDGAKLNNACRSKAEWLLRWWDERQHI